MLRLTFGTSLERIGDESLTRADSVFVHRNGLASIPKPAPYVESRPVPLGRQAEIALIIVKRIRVEPPLIRASRWNLLPIH